MELWVEFDRQLKVAIAYIQTLARRLKRRSLVLRTQIKHERPLMKKRFKRVTHRVWVEIKRMAAEIDIRKPVHAVIIGLIVAGIAAPAIGYFVTEARYYLDYSQLGVMTEANTTLGDMLSENQSSQTIYFNKSAQSPSGDYGMTDIGSGTSKVGYAATLPVQAGGGIQVTDTQHQTSVTMSPQYSTMSGRIVGDRVLYPLQNQAGVLALTPKGNGLKEDIVLSSAPADTETYNYKLDVEDGLQARLEPDGSIGVYSGDPSLFGNITYSTDADRQMVEKAREKSAKNYLMFEIPAPVVNQTNGMSNGVKAHFTLSGSNLGVVVTGLDKASYPLSVDPSFVITSVSDFLLGKVEDNITVSQPGSTDGQLNRATITAGTINATGWGSTGSALPAGCSNTGTNFDFGMTAYDGYMYTVGGGGGGVADECYAAISSSNGTLGSWTADTNALVTGRSGAAVVGFNGYLYAIGGENGPSGSVLYNLVDYSQINTTTGAPGAWTESAATGSFELGTGRSYFGAEEYDGYIYACGGETSKNDRTLTAVCEYTAINSDGTLYKPSSSCTLSGTSLTWCTTTSLSQTIDKFGMAVYNGYIYVVGGYNGTSVLTTVYYAPILSNNAIGTWNTTTSFSGILAGWRFGGVAAEMGHLYMVGGCTTGASCTNYLNGTYYTVINADGTLGTWDTTATFTTGRVEDGVTSNAGYIYMVGGCTNEPSNNNGCSAQLGDTNYAQISPTPGDTTNALASGGTIAVAMSGTASVAYDGNLWEVGGCSGTSCGTFNTTVDKGTVNDDGSVTWTTTGQTQLTTAIANGALEAYGNKLFYIGGQTGASTYSNAVYDGTISGGSVTGWATDTHTFTNARSYLAAAEWNGYIYLTGGWNGTTYYDDVQYTKISGGVPTAPSGCGATVWCATTSFSSTGEVGLGAAAYAGYLYITGGRNGTTANTVVYQAPITNSTGAIGSFTTTGTALPTTADSYMGIVIHNNVIYAMGGMTPNTGNAASNNIACAPLNGSTGVVGTWTNTCSKTLTTAEWGGSAVAYNGRLYTVGGCTSTGVPPCTAYTATVSNFTVRNGGLGLFGTSNLNTNPWTYTAGCSASCSMTARADAQTVAYNSNIYVIGGCTAYTTGACTTGDISTCVQHAPVNSDGTLGTFSSCTSSPPDTQLSSAQARYGGAAIAYVGDIFLIGGSSSSNVDTADVISAPLSATGTVGAWSVNTSMPNARHYFGAALSGGYIYVAGGLQNVSGTETPQSNVMYSQIGENGTLINWTTDSNNFNTARYGLDVVAYDSNLYIGQGTNNGTTALGDMQYTAINSDGSLNAWNATTPEDQLGAYQSVAAANGYMYFFGSQTSGTDVFYAAINSNGTLGNLYRASNSGSQAAQPHGGAVFQNGFFYLTGGCTLSGLNCTTTSSTVEEAGQKAQARIGHYAKMFNTIVNTSPTLVQVNGNGQFDIIMRTEASGATQWGVPQFISPAYATKFYFLEALDNTGTNIGIAFNYFIFLAIDDSNTGAFPDTGSVATDIDIYYHPNPGRRLRHGASFTNTACNSIITNGCLLDTAQF